MSEPSDLDVRLKHLEALLLSRIDLVMVTVEERHAIYAERGLSQRTAVDAALAAAKEATVAAFASSEKAITKAEHAQNSYNQTHNDLARKMDEQSKANMPRLETEGRFRAVEEKIAELRDLLSRSGGVLIGSKAVKDEGRANVAMIIAIVGVAITVIAFAIRTTIKP